MYEPQVLTLQVKKQVDDGIGGLVETWSNLKQIEGYLDLTMGTDLSTQQNAFTEQSTHLAVIPEYDPDINDDMRLVDDKGRWYSITYVDDPVGVNHHLELYLNSGGDVNVS